MPRRPGAEGTTEFPTCRTRPTGKGAREALQGLERGTKGVAARGVRPGYDQCEDHRLVAPAFHTDLGRAPGVLPRSRLPRLGSTAVGGDGSRGQTSRTQTCCEFRQLCVMPGAPCSVAGSSTGLHQLSFNLSPSALPTVDLLGHQLHQRKPGSSTTVHPSLYKKQ